MQKPEYLFFSGKPNESPDRYLQESLTEALTDIVGELNEVRLRLEEGKAGIPIIVNKYLSISPSSHPSPSTPWQ